METGRNSNTSKFFIVAIVTCKYDEDPFKNKGTGVFTTFLPLYMYVYGDFFQTLKGS